MRKITIQIKKIVEHLRSWYGCYCVILLALILIVLLNNRGIGRYQIATSQFKEACWILDTKTSRLWVRALASNGSVYLGTNDEPRVKVQPLEKTGEEK